MPVWPVRPGRAFGPHSLNLTSISFQAIILGLLPLGILTVLGRALYAFKAINWISISGMFGVFTGSCVLIIAEHIGSIFLAIHHFALSQFATLLIVGIGFLIFTKKIYLKTFWRNYLFWKFRVLTGISIVYFFYPLPEFKITNKMDVLFNLIFNISVSSICLIFIWFIFGILKLDKLKKML